MRRLTILLTISLIAASCGGSNQNIAEVPELPQVTGEELSALVEESAEPMVVNVWASWCVPCRSEAPLLRRAAEQSGIRFIGLNVRDDQEGARGFIAEFFPNAPIEHYFDPGGDIPVSLGGTRGVPITFFYAPGGELVNVHLGVIDERTLALQLDEIQAR